MTNGEKYKTKRERNEAFNKFCSMYMDSGDSICENCTLRDEVDSCQFAWLELEADDEKPLPCPFCGNKDLDRNIYDEYENVSCVKCGYKSADFGDLAEAIAAHNRVAKKCMEVKE